MDYLNVNGLIQIKEFPNYSVEHCWKSRKHWLPAFSAFHAMVSKASQVCSNWDCVEQG